jgi:hypothetical protein
MARSLWAQTSQGVSTKRMQNKGGQRKGGAFDLQGLTFITIGAKSWDTAHDLRARDDRTCQSNGMKPIPSWTTSALLLGF